MYDAIRSVAKVAKDWHQLEAALLKQGIQTHYKWVSGTDNVQGISFSKGITKFKGSKIDLSLSYGKLNQLIEFNQQHGQRQQIASVNDITLSNRNLFSDKHGASLLRKLLEPDHEQDVQTPFELLRTKRKLKKGRRI
jgi:hypothetical protein